MASNPAPDSTRRARALGFGASLALLGAASVAVVSGAFESEETPTSSAAIAAESASRAAAPSADPPIAQAQSAAVDPGAASRSARAAEPEEPLDPFDFEIVGHVLSAERRPIVGARIRLYVATIPIPTPAVVESYRASGYLNNEILKRTATEGEFKFRGPFTEACDYLLVISAPDAATCARQVTDVRAGERRDVGEIVLEAGGEIVGSVCDAAGNPAKSARVGIVLTPALASAEVFLADLDPENLSPVAEDGTFVIAHVADGRYAVVAWSPELARGASPPVSLRRDRVAPPVHLRLAPGDVFTGLVVDPEGHGIGGAKLKLRIKKTNNDPSNNEGADEAPTSFDLPIGVETEDSGAFAAHGLVAGAQYDVSVSAKSYRDASLSTSAGRTGMRITLRPDLKLRGVVLDAETGRPIAGASVLSYRGRAEDLNPRNLDPMRVTGRSDAQGRFVAGDHDKAGPTRALAWAKGYAPGVSEAVQLVETGPIPETVVKLEHGAILAGSVVAGSSHNPAAGASVAAYFRDARWTDRPFRPGMIAVRTVADAEGRYRFEGLFPGLYAVEARHGSYGSSRTEYVTIAKAEKREGLELRLPAPGTIRGNVVAYGRSMGVRVTATRADGVRTAVLADPDQSFAIGKLGPGLYEVRAEQVISLGDLLGSSRGGRGISAATATVELKEGQIAEVSLRIPESTLGRVVGSVSDEGGPGAGFTLVLVPETVGQTKPLSSGGGGNPIFGTSTTATADMEGYFEMPPVKEGTYRLYAVPRGRAVAPKNAIASEPVQVMANSDARRDLFGRSGPLKGTVRRSNGGMPIRNAKITARVNGTRGATPVLTPGSAFVTSTRAQGIFDFGRLPGGSYDLHVEAPGYATKIVPGDIWGSAGDVIEVVLDPAQGATPPGKKR